MWSTLPWGARSSEDHLSVIKICWFCVYFHTHIQETYIRHIRCSLHTEISWPQFEKNKLTGSQPILHFIFSTAFAPNSLAWYGDLALMYRHLLAYKLLYVRINRQRKHHWHDLCWVVSCGNYTQIKRHMHNIYTSNNCIQLVSIQHDLFQFLQ